MVQPGWLEFYLSLGLSSCIWVVYARHASGFSASSTTMLLVLTLAQFACLTTVFVHGASALRSDSRLLWKADVDPCYGFDGICSAWLDMNDTCTDAEKKGDTAFNQCLCESGCVGITRVSVQVYWRWGY